jgi:hypothetical protein
VKAKPKTKTTKTTKPKLSTAAKSPKSIARTKAAATKKPAARRTPKPKQETPAAATILEVAEFISPAGDESNAIDLLKADHDELQDLLTRAEENEGYDEDTFDDVRRALELHTLIKEQIFYPHLLANGDAELQQIASDAIERHRQLARSIEELEMLAEDNDEFRARLDVVADAVDNRIAEEEDEMFPLVIAQIDGDMLVQLGTLMEAEKARAGAGSARTASA